ncbi:uncharacterized protein LOC127855653 isoform X2 [Dreissena polymorpha]|uniref:uncharacterized protein LOC127855653 isoform X2 n=1 Tax=Dreissena polymorpha TaxID=45954 RepID=UPI0022653A96|nr:uncharacterized protein LOC127855653 isoform X2 [Dreissena polymorpha]
MSSLRNMFRLSRRLSKRNSNDLEKVPETDDSSVFTDAIPEAAPGDGTNYIDKSSWTIGDLFAHYQQEVDSTMVLGNVKTEGTMQPQGSSSRKSDYEMPIDSGQVILYLFGGFNPVHSNHIQTLVEAKKWLEANTKFTIIATYICISPDCTIQRKCEKEIEPIILPFEHRKRLCEVACLKYDWIKVHQKVAESQGAVREVLRVEQNAPDAKCAAVFGSDRFMADDKKTGLRLSSSKELDKWFAVCVGREGMNENEKRWFDTHKGRKFAETGYYVIPAELSNVSSTKIREELRKFKKAATDSERAGILRGLVGQGYISEAEAEYIYQEYTTLVN